MLGSLVCPRVRLCAKLVPVRWLSLEPCGMPCTRGGKGERGGERKRVRERGGGRERGGERRRGRGEREGKGGRGGRERERGEGERERTRTRKLYKDCSLGSVKNLTTSPC